MIKLKKIQSPTAEKIKDLRKELKRYQKAYQILICYFDSISDEEKPKVDKKLSKLGL